MTEVVVDTTSKQSSNHSHSQRAERTNTVSARQAYAIVSMRMRRRAGHVRAPARPLPGALALVISLGHNGGEVREN